MIIFLLFLFFLLIIKFNIKVRIKIEGTKSEARIKFLFWNLKKKGKLFFRPKSILKDKMVTNAKNDILYILKAFRFESLEIYEEIGALETNVTAFALPLVSILTMIPLNFLNINFNNFKYKIIPAYTELKFNLIVETQITFRLLKIISSIINIFLDKLFLKKEVDFK